MVTLDVNDFNPESRKKPLTKSLCGKNPSGKNPQMSPVEKNPHPFWGPVERTPHPIWGPVEKTPQFPEKASTNFLSFFIYTLFPLYSYFPIVLIFFEGIHVARRIHLFEMCPGYVLLW